MIKIVISFISGVSILFGTVAAQNNGPVVLKFNMAPGDKFSYGTALELNINENLMGQDVKVYTQLGMYYEFGVMGDSAGWKKMSASFQRVVMHVNANGQAINVDTDSSSNNLPGDAAGMGKIFAALKGEKFFFTLNENGEIGKISGIKSFTRHVAQAAGLDSATTSTMVAKAFNEESFRQNLQQTFSFYPGKPVKPGDSWNTTTNTVNNGIPMKTENTYTLQSVNNNIATIKQSSKVTTPEGATLQGMQLDITGIIDGNSDYDLQTGIPVEGKADMKLDMKIKAQGQEIPMKMNIKTTTTGKKI
jgi:hypothetical protein